MQLSSQRRRAAMFIAVLAIAAIPAVTFAGTLFDDVDDTDTHIEGITFMHDSGVTQGCGDGTVYCPNDPVTRAQMGTFMYRLSGNDPAIQPSVNAHQLGGLTIGELATKVLFEQSDDLDDAEGVALTSEIEVGSAGFLVFTGQMSVSYNATATTIPMTSWTVVCWAAVDGTAMSPADNAETITDDQTDQCNVTGAVALDPGRHDITLEWAGSGDGVAAGPGSFWALWIPFSGEAGD